MTRLSTSLKLVYFFNSDDVMVGSGLKKMKGYISPVSMNELEKKRAEYWGILIIIKKGTRVEGNSETWEFLRNICENKEILDSKYILTKTTLRNF